MDKLPLHRRASWGKNQQSYDTYMRNDMAKSRSPTSSQDYGIGNFSYDDKHLVDWKMPDTVSALHLPAQLRDKADDWATSGAALDTALERIEALKADATYRGWPDKKHAHLARPHWPSPTGPGAQSPSAALGSPISPIPSSTTASSSARICPRSALRKRSAARTMRPVRNSQARGAIRP